MTTCFGRARTSSGQTNLLTNKEEKIYIYVRQGSRCSTRSRCYRLLSM